MELKRRQFLARTALLGGSMLSFGCNRALSLLPDDTPRTPSESILDEGQRTRLDRAADLIIPETDTPGALAAGVPDFVEMMLVDYYYEDERNRVIEGLDELERLSQQHHRVAFIDASEDAQIAMLAEVEREGLAAMTAAGSNPLGSFIGGPPAPPPAFFQSLRELVAVGFTTSEIAATEVFDFSPVHRGYEGRVPLTDSMRPMTGGH